MYFGLLLATTLIGGSGADEAFAIAIDPSGYRWVAGTTTSPDLPVTPDAIKSMYTADTCSGSRGSPRPCTDIFLAKLDHDDRVLYLTYLGGSGDDSVGNIAFAPDGSLYLLGNKLLKLDPARNSVSSMPIIGFGLIDQLGNLYIARSEYRLLHPDPAFRISTDEGRIWRSSLPGQSVLAVAADDVTVYAATADVPLLKSTDAGLTWRRLPNPPTYPVEWLKVLGSRVYAGTLSGLAISTDGGLTWTTSKADTSPLSSFVSSLATQGGALFAGTHAGVYKSTDNGLTWVPTALRSVTFDPGTHVSAVVTTPRAVLAATQAGLMRSIDAGSSWADVFPRPVMSVVEHGGAITLRWWNTNPPFTLRPSPQRSNGSTSLVTMAPHGSLLDRLISL